MKDIADALRDSFVSPNVPDANGDPANIVDAVAGLGGDILLAVKRLGNNGAGTDMGAIEAHGKAVLDAGEKIAAAILDLAAAIRERTP